MGAHEYIELGIAIGTMLIGIIAFLGKSKLEHMDRGIDRLHSKVDAQAINIAKLETKTEAHSADLLLLRNSIDRNGKRAVG